MAIYGTPLTMGGGGGGQNETLPPLLDNFKATRLEGGIVPPTANTLAFKDIPDGSKIKLVKGSNISGTVTYGKTTDLNHRIVFDSNDWTRKQFYLENDVDQASIYFSDIDQWLNSTKASDWWQAGRGYGRAGGGNYVEPDYANEQGFLYQLGITDELLAQNFNDINIDKTHKAKVALPWMETYSSGGYKEYTFFNNIQPGDVADYVYLIGILGNTPVPYNKPLTRAPSQLVLTSVFTKIHPMMEPKPETPVALDSDGSYFMFENQAGGIILSADKMPVSRANALAGAVWVYGEHEPKNVNDGTKVNLTREEIVLPEEGDTDIPPISYTELERPTSTKTWTATEDGYYKFVGVAEAGRSGTARRIAGASYNVSGGSGGSGGIVASVFKLKRGESVSLAVASGDVTISYGSETANATHGQDGGSSSSEPDNKVKLGSPGRAGTATGGNLINMNGKYGDLGERLEGNKATIVRGGKTVYEKHISRGGYAQSTRQEGDMVPADRGTTAYIAVLKGNDSSNEALNFTAKASKTIADLPSKSKVKLGKFSGIPLKWLVCRDSVDQSLRLILDGESVVVIGNKMFDNHEPNNPDSNRRNYGNNRYIWSNIRQWLNSDKPANQWYTAQHTYDAAPDYTNVAGFLHEWTEKEISVLENASWVVTKHSVDGGGSESFQSKVALPSTTEMGLESNTGGARIDIFNNNEDRVVSGVPYWCRTPYSSNAYDACTIHTGGTLHHYRTDNTGYGVRPLCKPVASTLVSNEPDSDGCYTLVFTPPLERTVVWDKKKEFYARQFTYNSKKQYQTMLKGAVSYLPIMPDGQELSKLPSKSKVKLGRYGDADLQWLVSRNAENKLILVLDSNSISALGNKMLDAAEPNNSNSNRRDYGNNRYIYTNLHQWLNAEKGANQWFVKAHNADTPPDYQNQAGFLNGWKKEELDLLELAEWTVTKSGTDGSGKETFRSRVVLPSTTEMGFSSEGGGSKLDIFNSDSDRQTGSNYWTRTPFPTSPCINYQVKSDGTQYSGGYNSYDGAIRPICSIPETTLVSIETDSEGCFTLI